MTFLSRGRTSLRAALRQMRETYVFPLKLAYASARRRSMRGMTVIGITGSSGKSTTTALLSGILAEDHRVAFNRLENHISSVARTLRKAPRDTQYAVIEVSAGDTPKIEKTAKLIGPDVAVVTMVALEHHKTFRTPEGVCREKGHLVEALGPSGLAVLNFDDPLVMSMTGRTSARVVTFGLSAGADYVASEIVSGLGTGLRMRIDGKGQTVELALQLYGRHFYLPVLAAVACALELGIAPPTIRKALAGFEGYGNRCGIVRIPDGPVFLVDTCKSPAHSVTLPMDMLKTETAPRKTVVLGHVSDYGGNPRKVYSAAVRHAATVADRIVLTGPTSHKARVPELEESHRIVRLPEVHEVADFLKTSALPGEIILLKSSQNIHLERAYLAFLQDVNCRIPECGRTSGCISCGLSGLPGSEHPRREHQRRRLVQALKSGKS
ncbi:Mur ligase family protein [Aquibium microcysteis]|uniref:Mur ligase family protein n=1 Tax=Aquibium microcysteis TaxID=675281 RepID=UPI00165D2C5D|nr:Mur ligase family protein [Aquibium microcysteis]